MDNNRQRTYAWEDPMPAASQAVKLSGMDYFKKMQAGELPPPPVAMMLNMQLTHIDEGCAVFTLTPSEYHYNPIGSVHGGIAATLLDSAMGCAIHSMMPAGVGYTTIELKVNYLRPLTMETGPVQCEGHIIHVGRRLATAEGRITDAAGKLYAHGSTTCMVFGVDGN